MRREVATMRTLTSTSPIWTEASTCSDCRRTRGDFLCVQTSFVAAAAAAVVPVVAELAGVGHESKSR